MAPDPSLQGSDHRCKSSNNQRNVCRARFPKWAASEVAHTRPGTPLPCGSPCNSRLYFQSLPECSFPNTFPFMVLHGCQGVPTLSSRKVRERGNSGNVFPRDRVAMPLAANKRTKLSQAHPCSFRNVLILNCLYESTPGEPKTPFSPAPRSVEANLLFSQRDRLAQPSPARTNAQQHPNRYPARFQVPYKAHARPTQERISSI